MLFTYSKISTDPKINKQNVTSFIYYCWVDITENIDIAGNKITINIQRVYKLLKKHKTGYHAQIKMS